MYKKSKKPHLVVSLSLKSTDSSVTCKLVVRQMKRSLIEWKIIYIIVVALVSKPSLFIAVLLLVLLYRVITLHVIGYRQIASSH